MGILVFEPRHPGDSNLYLQMTSRFDNTRSDKLLAARFTGSPRQDRLESTYTFRNEAGVKIDDYQLELLLWSPFAGQLSSGPDQEGPSDQTQTVNPTSTAVGKTPMGETAVGVTVVGEYSFNIQNLPKGSTDIIVLQLLSDGTVFLLDGDEVRTPEIILVPTEVLPGAPYPSPVAP